MSKSAGLPDRPQLKKAIGGLGFFSLAFGSIIGVGWITALGGWFEKAGPGGSMLAFVGGGALMLLIGLCYAEITPMLPVTGGEVAYAYKAFGPTESFIIGWFLAFGYLSVSAFEAISVGMVLSFMFPKLDYAPLYEIAGSTVYAAHLALAACFTVLIMAINFFGVALAARIQIILTLLLISVTTVFVAAGVARGSVENLSPLFGTATGTHSLAGMLAVFVTVPFWYVGFDTVPQAAEERREESPLNRLGLYVIVAIIGSTAFYVAVMCGAGMAVPWQTIIDETLPTAVVFEKAFQTRLLVNLVLLAGLIGLLTSWNGFFLAGSRVLFALGRGHILHTSFGKTHPRYQTPTTAIVFSGVFTILAAFLGWGAMLAFVNVGSFCITVAFLGVALSVSRLRDKCPDMERPYKMPGGKLVARLAALGSLFILLVMLLPGSPGRLAWPLEWAILSVLSVAGVCFWFAAKGYRDRIGESERARMILEDYA